MIKHFHRSVFYCHVLPSILVVYGVTRGTDHFACRQTTFRSSREALILPVPDVHKGNDN